MELNNKKADLNRDGQLSGYEKKRGMAIQNAMSSNSSLRKPNDKKFMGTTSYKEKA